MHRMKTHVAACMRHHSLGPNGPVSDRYWRYRLTHIVALIDHHHRRLPKRVRTHAQSTQSDRSNMPGLSSKGALRPERKEPPTGNCDGPVSNARNARRWIDVADHTGNSCT
uniref:Uncharacterized protein n=1 Tax=Anopheles atroparvus TaxID=41427 RepID=A0AAG5CRY8_ANOAO